MVKLAQNEGKDIILLRLDRLKFIALIFDEDIAEFTVYSMFNFDNQAEFQQTGKRFPTHGLTCTISTNWFSAFGFLADDTIFAWV